MNDAAEAGNAPEHDTAGPAPSSPGERMRILEMLAQHRITATEAAELLAALGDGGAQARRPGSHGRFTGPPPPSPARWFRIRVTDVPSGRTRANVAVPLGMVGFGAGLAGRWGGAGNRQVDDILTAIRAGRRGSVFDVHGDDCGQRIELIIE